VDARPLPPAPCSNYHVYALILLTLLPPALALPFTLACTLFTLSLPHAHSLSLVLTPPHRPCLKISWDRLFPSRLPAYAEVMSLISRFFKSASNTRDFMHVDDALLKALRDHPTLRVLTERLRQLQAVHDMGSAGPPAPVFE
jgi:hypothetical protein